MSDCIIPKNKPNQFGYISIKFRGRYQPIHRLAYKILNSDLPSNLFIDHNCHNEAAARGECQGGNSCQHRACINPEHLRAVTHKENVQAGLRVMANNKQCKNGHDVADNLAYRPSGRAYCVSCRKETHAKYNLKRRGSK